MLLLKCITGLLVIMISGLGLAAESTLQPSPVREWVTLKGRPVTSGNEVDATGRIRQVTAPVLDLLRSTAAKPRGTILLLPGGGYGILAIDHEGNATAKYLNQCGFDVAILEYRIGKNSRDLALEDSLKAWRLLRSKSKELGLHGDRLGIMGFSAGGHLAARTVQTLAANPKDRQPDDVILIYPAYLNECPKGSTKPFVTAQANATGRLFVLIAANDKPVWVKSSEAYVKAWKKTKAPAVFHLLPDGGHGFGMRQPLKGAAQQWPELLKTFLDANQSGTPRIWPSEPPTDCPIPASTEFSAIQFTGRHAEYTQADTWYPSWGADDRLYSPFTDGKVNGVGVRSGGGAKAAVGHAIIEGNDPLNLKVIEPATIPGSTLPYGGRYPCGSLHYNGVWYLGTYGLLGGLGGEAWGICGPFAGFHISIDNGKTWTPSPRSTAPGNGVFPEPAIIKGPVKFGVPHVVDFGKNMEHSPDGKMYMVAHGATQWEGKDRNANCGWLTGDQIYLCRVTPSPKTVNDGKCYEYFGGHNETGKPVWTNDLKLARPVVDWNNQCGSATITYNAPLKKYLMCVSTAKHTMGPAYDTFLLEADAITGPYRMITYMKAFGTQGYFVNIPSKFISKDGRTLWLCYSANWTVNLRRNKGQPPLPSDPTGSGYALCLQEIRLAAPTSMMPPPAAQTGRPSKDVEPPKPYGPVATPAQLKWHDREVIGMVNFSTITYYGKEWGYGNEDPARFNPARFNATQIVQAAKSAGMQLLVIDAKHHGGFCLWPSAYTSYSVKSSPWRNGKGDMVRELVDACRAEGLGVGMYLSPWDRNHAEYGRPAYVKYYHDQLRELLGNYGEILEVWFDGANGGNGWYGGAKTTRKIGADYYQWDKITQIVRQLQPNAVMFNREDARWVGNERGIAGDPCWATSTSPGGGSRESLNRGDRNGKYWCPAEADFPLRRGWFWHPGDKPRSAATLVDLYFSSVGRNSVMDIGIAPDREGLICKEDADSLQEFSRRIAAIFSNNLSSGVKVTASNIRGNSPNYAAANVLNGKQTGKYWATDDNVTEADITLAFPQPITFSVISLREQIALGQRVDDWALEACVNGQWKQFAAGSCIGAHRLWRGQPFTAEKIRLRITKASVCPAICEFAVYLEPESDRLESGVQADNSYDPGMTKTGWTIFSTSSPGATLTNAIDSKHGTFWHTHTRAGRQAPPQEIAVDMGAEHELAGFLYLPRQDGDSTGNVTAYRIAVSLDGQNWMEAAQGEFGNIAANPVQQRVMFTKPTKARFIKFTATAAIGGCVNAAEIGVIESSARKDIKAYDIDFNWGPGGPNGFAKPGLWADADPARHVAWYKTMGVNAIQTFCVSCNGYAWYKNGVVPQQPGLKHDFLREMVRLGHRENMLVLGYFCAGSNTRWGMEHPQLSYGIPSEPHIPYTDEYLAYLDSAIRDAVGKTGIDGFMIDWLRMPTTRKSNGGRWLDCEKKLYAQLMGETFPGEKKLSAARMTEYGRRAVERCWTTIRRAAKETNPNCIVWLTCCDVNDPHIVNSRALRETDWLLNEAGDAKRTADAKRMIGPHTRLITCLANWNKQDPMNIVPAAMKEGIGLYGFTKPGPDSLLPLESLLARPVRELKGDEKNIAVLARAFHGVPMESIRTPDGRFIEPKK